MIWTEEPDTFGLHPVARGWGAKAGLMSSPIWIMRLSVQTVVRLILKVKSMTGVCAPNRVRIRRMLWVCPPGNACNANRLEQLMYQHGHEQKFNRLNS